ncbi:MAG: hypothetical protein BZ137_00895 [Methanosphaera sp. rholeuAM130]|nr:restriction endonuclease subunit S [Methanosphaera sp.]RAP54682.1 MAG: hypothetical protein BZ137_00895 [Methanosphaera sp. rholeuAM130]
MQTETVKLKDIAKIITGLPIQRYIDKEETEEKTIILNMPALEIDEKFPTTQQKMAAKIKNHFYSREHDILYKVQQQSFAKEITSETDAIITNSYLIIRINDFNKVNPTFLTYYLNDPRVHYQIQRTIDSTKIMKVNTKILKDLNVLLPSKQVQDAQVDLIKKINERIEAKKKSIQCDEKLINSLYDAVIGDAYEN